MNARSVLWTDVSGLQTITLVRTNAGATALQAAMLAVSNADYLQWWESAITANGAPAPVAATYQSVTDRAVLTFVCADNTQAVLQVIAPQSAIFMADQQTVNPVAIAALIAAAIGSLVSTTGSLATTYVAGTRVSR